MNRSDRQRFVLVSLVYLFAAAGGIWLAAPACNDPLWIHYAFFVALVLALVAVIFFPIASGTKTLRRIPVAVGPLLTIFCVRFLTQPLFPGIDYGGPSSFQDYFSSLYWSSHAESQHGSFFGACSGLETTGR